MSFFIAISNFFTLGVNSLHKGSAATFITSLNYLRANSSAFILYTKSINPRRTSSIITCIIFKWSFAQVGTLKNIYLKKDVSLFFFSFSSIFFRAWSYNFLSTFISGRSYFSNLLSKIFYSLLYIFIDLNLQSYIIMVNCYFSKLITKIKFYFEVKIF